MTERIPFDLPPRAEFADRLEAALLQAIGAPTDHSAATNDTTRVAARRDHDEEHLMTITDDRPIDTSNHRGPRRWINVAAAATVLAVLAAGFWAVTRRDRDVADSHDVEFNVQWSVNETVNDCPNDTNVPTCGFTYKGPATARFDGDIKGNAYQSIVWNNSDDFPDDAVRHEEKVATFVVHGTVKGCGVGEFLVAETLQFTSGPDRDFSAGTITGTWQIVPNSGRGDLRSIAGSGTSTGNPIRMETDGIRHAGTITCTPPPDLSANEITAPLGSVAVPSDTADITPAAGDLPDGTYRVSFTAADLDRLEPDIIHDFTDGGTLEITLRGGTYTVQGFLPSGTKDGDPFEGTYQVTGGTLVWLLPGAGQIPGTNGINVFEWSADGDTLTFDQIDGKHRDPWFVIPWTKVG